MNSAPWSQEPALAAAVMLAETERDRVRPLWQLLRERGIDVSRQMLLEECAGDYTLTSMARCIQRRGLLARVIIVGRAEALQLGSTLVELLDGRLALLQHASGGRARFECEDGKVVDARHVTVAKALELGKAWPSSGKFLARLLKRALEGGRLRRSLFVFGSLTLAAGALGYVGPAVARIAVDEAIAGGGPHLLAALAVTLAICGGFQAVLATLSERAALYAETHLAAACSQGLLAHYLALPLERAKLNTAGDVSQTLGIVPLLVRSCVRSTIAGAADVVLAVGYLAWVAQLAPLLAVTLLAAYVALTVVLVAWSNYASRQQHDVMLAAVEQHDRLLEIIRRIVTIRAEAIEAWAIGRWKRALSAEQLLSARFDLSSASIHEVEEVVRTAVVGATVLWAAQASLTGGRSLGEFFALVAAGAAASGALTQLSSLVSSTLPLRAQLARVDELLQQPVASLSSSRYGGPRQERGIHVDQAWFRYHEHGSWVIEGFSLSVPRGGIEHIRWPSGAGKSTLLRLIAGLAVPQRGSVTINGLEAQAARHLVAYIPQSCPLFDGSVLYNLRILSGDAPLERIREAVLATGLDRAVASWPMGLDTVIAGSGANVSSGQRQLLILTAVLASTRPVLLLDEATSHLDVMLRAGLRLSGLLEGRTVVNVMHLAAETGSAHPNLGS